MGWAAPTAFSHAARLVSSGLVKRCAMRRGEGSLLYATSAGVSAAGVLAVPVPGEPGPTTWAHWTACGWTAAWLTTRGRHIVGGRELLLDPAWHGELEWLERDGLRRRGHQPDLVAGVTAGNRLLPVEVELAGKSTIRLRSILSLYATWISAGRTDAVIYICGNQRLAERVRRHGDQIGLSAERRTLRVELLKDVREAATAAQPQPTRHSALAAQPR